MRIRWGIISAWLAECAVQPTIDAKEKLESPLRSGLKLLSLRARPLIYLDRARSLRSLAEWVTSSPVRRVCGEPYADILVHSAEPRPSAIPADMIPILSAFVHVLSAFISVPGFLLRFFGWPNPRERNADEAGGTPRFRSPGTECTSRGDRRNQ